MRVIVHSGSEDRYIGRGTIVGNATTYGVVAAGDGAMISARDATEYPTEIVEQLEDMGVQYEVVKLDGNVKIVMDNGDVYYGMQVWWYPDDGEDASAPIEVDIRGGYDVLPYSRITDQVPNKPQIDLKKISAEIRARYEDAVAESTQTIRSIRDALNSGADSCVLSSSCAASLIKLDELRASIDVFNRIMAGLAAEYITTREARRDFSAKAIDELLKHGVVAPRGEDSGRQDTA